MPGAGNPQALNRYSYVLNSPLTFIDPTGHFVESGTPFLLYPIPCYKLPDKFYLHPTLQKNADLLEMCYYLGMGSYERKLHKPGVLVYQIKGDLTPEDVTRWRDDIKAFVKENAARGACGILIDALGVEGFSVGAVDSILELLAEPEETLADVRTRFALIGIKRHTQRFFRSAMPIIPLKHVRGRFFHETARAEALAWLSAMVESADALPKTAKTTPPDGKAKAEEGKEEPKKESTEAKQETPSPEPEAKPDIAPRATPEEKRASLKARIKG